MSYHLTVLPGLSIRTATGSYVFGGAITASQVTVMPNGSGAVSSVRMSSGTATPYVLVGGGASGTDDEVGIQLATSGPTCTTDLEIGGSSSPRFTANGLLISGCVSTSPVIAEGTFSGKLSGQPVPLGSASLPPISTANLLASGISQFATAEVNTLPSLTGAVQSIVQAYPRLPVGPPPVQVVTAVLTRIGLAAFSETLTAVGPSLADAPFSRVVESFDLEVVASSCSRTAPSLTPRCGGPSSIVAAASVRGGHPSCPDGNRLTGHDRPRHIWPWDPRRGIMSDGQLRDARRR